MLNRAYTCQGIYRDFELTPDTVGEYRIEVRTGNGVLIAVMSLRAS